MAHKGISYLSLPKVALVLGISRASAYTWVLAGRIPATMIAGRYVVSHANLRRVVKREAARPRDRRRAAKR